MSLRVRRLGIVSLLAIGSWQGAGAAWIHAKAQLAQHLLGRAWRARLAGARDARPWPWADTQPVARLTVPAQGIDLFVLDGASGRTMAFGPGHLAGTPLPGEPGNSVVSGHRDTHFAFLRHLKAGDAIVVEGPDARRQRYVVSDALVLDRREVAVTVDRGDTRLTLVTCYPFDALRPGGPLRYVVTARLDSGSGLDAEAYSLDEQEGSRLSRDRSPGTAFGGAVELEHLKPETSLPLPRSDLETTLDVAMRRQQMFPQRQGLSPRRVAVKMEAPLLAETVLDAPFDGHERVVLDLLALWQHEGHAQVGEGRGRARRLSDHDPSGRAFYGRLNDGARGIPERVAHVLDPPGRVNGEVKGPDELRVLSRVDPRGDRALGENAFSRRAQEPQLDRGGL